MPKQIQTPEKPTSPYSKKKLASMVMQNNLESCSLITKVLNNVDVFISDEITGEILDKDKTIEHFVVIRDFQNEEYMKNFDDLFKTRKSKSKNDEIMEDQLNLLAPETEESTDEAEFDLDNGDQTSYLPHDQLLELIAKELRIKESSLAVLQERGWYIVPIYAEQTEFRPIFFEETKKGISLVLKHEPLFIFDKTAFPKDAPANTWQYNSVPILNSILQSDGRFMVYAPIRHFRDKYNVRALKVATRMFENVQKARIKIGNNIISNIYVQHGNIGFNDLKLEQAMQSYPELFNDELYTADGGEISEDILKKREKVVKDLKVLDYVSREYDYLQNYVRSVSGIPSAILKSVRSMTEKGKTDEEIMLKIAQKIEITPFSSYINTEEKFDAIVKQLEEQGNKLLFLTTYDLYNQTREWINYGEIENETKMYAESLVVNHPIWIRFLKGVVGCGPQLAAQIISGFDFYKAEHPSSFLKYVGLDQIPVRPNPENEITQDHRLQAINLVVDSYKRIIKMAEQTNDEITKVNFYTFASDGIETFEDYKVVEDWYDKSTLSDLDSPSKTQDKISTLATSWLTNFSAFEKLITKICTSYVIKENTENASGSSNYIYRRARTKQDRQIATYRTAKNKIAVKKYLGYNSQLKGTIMGKLFPCMLKQKSKSYYERVYREYTQRLVHRPDLAKQQADFDAKVKGVKAPNIHEMGRRKVCQLFLEDLFIQGKRAMGLSDNGGTYAEAKLGIHHHQGITPPNMFLKTPSEFKTAKAYEEYLKDNQI